MVPDLEELRGAVSTLATSSSAAATKQQQNFDITIKKVFNSI